VDVQKISISVFDYVKFSTSQNVDILKMLSFLKSQNTEMLNLRKMCEYKLFRLVVKYNSRKRFKTPLVCFFTKPKTQKTGLAETENSSKLLKINGKNRSFLIIKSPFFFFKIGLMSS